MAEILVKSIRKHDEGRTLRLRLSRKDIIDSGMKKLNINFKEIDKKNRGVKSENPIHFHENILEKKTKKRCCHCCCFIPSHLFMVYIPISYNQKEFLVRPQHFCSYDCASTYCDKELRNDTSARCMLTIYHKKFSNEIIDDLSINVPSPFKYLEEYGGQYDENEFRKKFIKNVITLSNAKKQGKNIKISIVKTYQRISDAFSYGDPEISFGDLYDKLLMETDLENIVKGTSKYVVQEYDYSDESCISLVPSEQHKKTSYKTYEDRIYEEEEQRLIEAGKLSKREVFLLKDIVEILKVKKLKKKKEK